jgi:heptosyltransferase II
LLNRLIRCKPWKRKHAPKKILAIRLQAFGDTMITLPFLKDLQSKIPGASIHFLTRQEVSAIPKQLAFFERVLTIGGKRNAKLQFILMLLKLPFLFFQRYDVVLDLQNNKISRAARVLLFPNAWSEFDKTSPLSAAERTRQTIEAVGIAKIGLDTDLILRTMVTQNVLENTGLAGNDIVVLNPAGYCASRSWPLEHYVAFARMWLKDVSPLTRFVLLLLPSMRHKATFIKNALGDSCIDLTGRTNQLEAFQILGLSRLVITEDSGLMHMGWIQGIPTVALFSSSRKDWSAPQGNWSVCLDSSDLECGPCGLEVCSFGDNRCIVRYTPATVLANALQVMQTTTASA